MLPLMFTYPAYEGEKLLQEAVLPKEEFNVLSSD